MRATATADEGLPTIRGMLLAKTNDSSYQKPMISS
jgi:hypothetical protein